MDEAQNNAHFCNNGSEGVLKIRVNHNNIDLTVLILERVLNKLLIILLERVVSNLV